MNAPVDELYFKWLYAQVADPGLTEKANTCWGLLKQLYTKEFVWIVPNDDNRVEDGKYLRIEFLDSERVVLDDPIWIELGCSMLELLIGLSRRLAFEAEGEPADWFWQLMDNLGLAHYDDRKKYPREDVDFTLDEVIWRRYLPSGRGGLFPLHHTDVDQRKIELWYQLSAYVLERM
jgi:hypothetical protein